MLFVFVTISILAVYNGDVTTRISIDLLTVISIGPYIFFIT